MRWNEVKWAGRKPRELHREIQISYGDIDSGVAQRCAAKHGHKLSVAILAQAYMRTSIRALPCAVHRSWTTYFM